MKLPLLFACLACAAPTASAQYLLVVDSTAKKVLLLSDFDGSVLNASYINLALGPVATPIEAGVVGNEIWVSDQIADGCLRFSLDGTTYLGLNTGGVNNVRGFAYANGDVYITSATSGPTPVPPVEAVVRFNTAYVNQGYFATPEPYDVIAFNGDLLVSDGFNDDIRRYDYAGNFLSLFVNSDGVTGIDQPEQLALRSNGNVLAANFSTPLGVYEYDPSGNQVNFWQVGNGNRGVAELGNGKIVWTDSAGIHTIDPVNSLTADIQLGVNARFVTRFAGSGTPSTASCFGDGTETACPCANPGIAGRGCANGSFASGAQLSSTGFASIGADTLVLKGFNGSAFGAGLYFQGSANLSPAGASFGHGVVCMSGTTPRLEIVNPQDANGASQTVGIIHNEGGIGSPGTYSYQWWYRDATTVGSCSAPGSAFNFSNAITLTWTP